MSAYAGEKGGQIYNLNGAPGTAQVEGQLEQLPPLPQIAKDLESYFAIARQLEAALIHERMQARKTREELQLIQHKCNQLISEIQNKHREYLLREDALKAQLKAHEQTERGLHDQIEQLCRQTDGMREDRKKSEMDQEFLKSHIENYKRREQSLKYSLQSVQSAEKSRAEQIEKLNYEMQKTRAELARYQAAWGKVVEADRKTKQVVEDNYEMKRKMEEMNEALSNEKKRREDVEELMKKEKRDKQLALSCLHTAEAKMSQMARQLEELKVMREKSFDDRGLELKF